MTTVDPASPSRRQPMLVAAISVGLAVVTLAIFGRMVWDNHDFVNYDDWLYVTRQPMVNEGLRLDAVIWAFRFDTEVGGNWHPLTLVSHMIDCSLFGLERPAGHHFTSLLLHTANTVLLFLVFVRLTGNVWSAALVAALFAWHPLRVESVAWVAERKDVLCALFWILTMGAYHRYVHAQGARRVAAYLATCALFAMGLMSKPMVVTLPCVLLLLDFWPLGRMPTNGFGKSSEERRQVWGLVLEKIPMFVLAAIVSGLTFAAQRATGSVANLTNIPWLVRLFNVIWSYNDYISKMLYPVGLAVRYPIAQRELHLFNFVAGLAGIILITVLTFMGAKNRRYLPVGWLWYVGTMVPVIGFVQVGTASMADRYTYLPLIGVYIIIAWGLRDLFAARPAYRPLGLVVTAAALATLCVATYRQVGHWKNTIVLFDHTVRVTERNHIAYISLATAYYELDEFDRAYEYLEKAIEIEPKSGMAWHNKGSIHYRRDEWEETVRDLEEAHRLNYVDVQLYHRLGHSYHELGRFDPADEFYQKALELDPSDQGTLLHYGRLLFESGHIPEAFNVLEGAIRYYPEKVDYRMLVARILATARQGEFRDEDRAVAFAESVCSATKDPQADWLDTLAAAYAAAGRYDEAYETAQRALRKALAGEEVKLAAEIEDRMALYAAGRPYRVRPPNRSQPPLE